MIEAPVIYWFAGVLDVPAPYASRFRTSQRIARGRGPDGVRDGLFAASWPCDAVAYAPAAQRWDRVTPDVWIGVRRDATPAAFVRATAPRVAGRAVCLADGHRWVVPVANPFLATCSLPQWDVLRDGVWQRQVVDAYADVSARAATLAGMMQAALLEHGKAEITMDDDAARLLVADALAVNYDVTLEELSVLRVFSESATAEAIQALIDWPEMLRVLSTAVGIGGARPDPFGESDADVTPCIAPGGSDC